MKIKYDSWDKISIKKFNEIKDIFSEKKLTEESDILDTNIRLVACLCDSTEDEVINLPVNELNNLLSQTDFLKEEPKVNIRTEYEVCGEKYELVTDLKKITTSQYIDYQTFIKDGYKNMANICAVFLLPKGKKYGENYDILDIGSIFEQNLRYVDAMAIFGFFFLQFKISIKIILDSSIRMMKKKMRKEKDKVIKMKIGRIIVEMKQYKNDLLESGDG